MDQIKETLRQFIVAQYLPGESPANLRDETRLQTSGILDSLATLGLIDFIEKEFRIEVTASERTPESLDRIQDIAGLVLRKRLN